MGVTWAPVRERVLALRKAPRWREVFGADFHGYGHNFELLPVLTEERLQAVERRLGTVLPERSTARSCWRSGRAARDPTTGCSR